MGWSIWIEIPIVIAIGGMLALGAWFRLKGALHPPLSLYEEIAKPLRRMQLAAAAPFADPEANGGAIPVAPREWRDATVGRRVRLTYEIERSERGYLHVVIVKPHAWRGSSDDAMRCLMVVTALLSKQAQDAGIPLAALNYYVAPDPLTYGTTVPVISLRLAPLHHVQLMEVEFDAERAAQATPGGVTDFFAGRT